MEPRYSVVSCFSRSGPKVTFQARFHTKPPGTCSFGDGTDTVSEDASGRWSTATTLPDGSRIIGTVTIRRWVFTVPDKGQVRPSGVLTSTKIVSVLTVGPEPPA